MLRDHLLSTVIGLLLGFGVVWWVTPNSSGAVFLVVLTCLLCVVVGLVARLTLRVFRRTRDGD